VEGRPHPLIDTGAEMCLEVVAQEDFDGDGARDALVRHDVGCGGNCCGNSYFFYGYRGDGHFQRTEEFGYAWTEPRVEKWQGRWSVVVTSANEGLNRDAPAEVTERYVLDAGRAVKVEESARPSRAALAEMRVDSGPSGLSYDLDGDGTADRITGEICERWGRFLWTVRFSSGAEFTSSVGCKRIGVLSTKTNGVHDLVCDQDDVLTWNGRAYEMQRE
jgi:hypothetical protein